MEAGFTPVVWKKNHFHWDKALRVEEANAHKLGAKKEGRNLICIQIKTYISYVYYDGGDMQEWKCRY